ncbi:MAG TPA: hypothetical protein VGQ36_16590 [Thermoanaerobaculia bacterium]|jgi:hypothetical protein|nr:hypothetical protein [Thermoanaerobaculia bacterium]
MTCSLLYTARDGRNYRVFTWWMTAAMLTFAAATILIDGNFIPTAAGWALTTATAILMVAAMRSYIVFLRNADELLRKVHLEALAFAFGAGLVAMMCYRLCERLGAPKLDVNDGGLVLFIVWIGGQWIGARRYAVAEEQ